MIPALPNRVIVRSIQHYGILSVRLKNITVQLFLQNLIIPVCGKLWLAAVIHNEDGDIVRVADKLHACLEIVVIGKPVADALIQGFVSTDDGFLFFRHIIILQKKSIDQANTQKCRRQYTDEDSGHLPLDGMLSRMLDRIFHTQPTSNL